MMSEINNVNNNYRVISKQLKQKANDFLNSKKHANNLVDIINYFEESLEKNQNVSSCILTLEVVFAELIKRKEFYIEVKPLKPKEPTAENIYKEWLNERFEDFCRLLLTSFHCEKSTDSVQALTSSMKLLSWEGKYPIEYNPPDTYYFPVSRFRNILIQILSTEKSSTHLTDRFKEYSEYLDIVFYAWKLLPSLTPKGNAPNEVFFNNYLELINALPVTKQLQESFNLFCTLQEPRPQVFDYVITRKRINKVWNCVMQWEIKIETHKQLLVILLEKVLPHLDKPVLLTDFLMDSLDIGGAVGLLALQGIFILIQKYNITYPNIYEKLYSMFEPEIFHTKYKARLFYLADIFLSSTHLPENLVAAFVKRLARLALLAPPQDILIILYFIGNLILRHPGLKKLICDPNGGEVCEDPYIMDERDPTKSNALESSLWEVQALQSHLLPSVATAAQFISKPLPTQEWDLSDVLELTEEDIFDQEISRKWDECALAIDRPTSIALPKNDVVTKYFNLF